MAAVTPATRMLHVQRSCGYAWRPSIPIAEIGRLAEWLREAHPDVVLFVDNWCASAESLPLALCGFGGWWRESARGGARRRLGST